MSKHSPGPWRIGKNYGAVVCDSPTGRPVAMNEAEHCEAYGGHLVCESIVSDADARLIAAAPELLALCRALAGNAIALGTIPGSIVKSAMAVIEKAEGG